MTSGFLQSPLLSQVSLPFLFLAPFFSVGGFCAGEDRDHVGTKDCTDGRADRRTRDYEVQIGKSVEAVRRCPTSALEMPAEHLCLHFCAEGPAPLTER